MKKAFTLVEIIMVLTVVGVIASIVLPMALQDRPNENIVKFKKAQETLYTLINELATSGKYYCNGDLGLKAPNCELLTSNADNRLYFCETIADVLSTKSVNCLKQGTEDTTGARLLTNETAADYLKGSLPPPFQFDVTAEQIQNTKNFFDSTCKSSAKNVGAQIITSDGITYYESRPATTFGYKNAQYHSDLRYFAGPGEVPTFQNKSGADIAYKIFCIDIDGIPSGGSDYCKNDQNANNICPFGYGIRADGKIMPGAQADEWVDKTMESQG